MPYRFLQKSISMAFWRFDIAAFELAEPQGGGAVDNGGFGRDFEEIFDRLLRNAVFTVVLV